MGDRMYTCGELNKLNFKCYSEVNIADKLTELNSGSLADYYKSPIIINKNTNDHNKSIKGDISKRAADNQIFKIPPGSKILKIKNQDDLNNILKSSSNEDGSLNLEKLSKSYDAIEFSSLVSKSNNQEIVVLNPSVLKSVKCESSKISSTLKTLRDDNKEKLPHLLNFKLAKDVWMYNRIRTKTIKCNGLEIPIENATKDIAFSKKVVEQVKNNIKLFDKMNSKDIGIVFKPYRKNENDEFNFKEKDINIDFRLAMCDTASLIKMGYNADFRTVSTVQGLYNLAYTHHFSEMKGKLDLNDCVQKLAFEYKVWDTTEKIFKKLQSSNIQSLQNKTEIFKAYRDTSLSLNYYSYDEIKSTTITLNIYSPAKPNPTYVPEKGINDVTNLLNQNSMHTYTSCSGLPEDHIGEYFNPIDFGYFCIRADESYKDHIQKACESAGMLFDERVFGGVNSFYVRTEDIRKDKESQLDFEMLYSSRRKKWSDFYDAISKKPVPLY